MTSKIEWCDETINPLGWGCYGPTGSKDNPKPCPYCYARDFAKRHLRDCPDCDAFIPHWHPEQLEKLAHWKKPRKIFVQSMGDLFHADTPTEQTQAVLGACLAAPQHTYQFLTKNPIRYADIEADASTWLGTTITSNLDDQRAFALRDVCRQYHPTNRPVSFVSMEPLLGFVDCVDVREIDLLIVGAMTGPKAVKPQKEWLESVIATGHKNILWKENIKPYLKEYGLSKERTS